jgi:hypothetical protein
MGGRTFILLLPLAFLQLFRTLPSPQVPPSRDSESLEVEGHRRIRHRQG